jgi:hypothetical protein
MPVVLPPLRWNASPNQSQRLHPPVRLVVVHRPVGGYAGSIAVMCDPTPEGDPRKARSTHAIVREDGAEATQLVAWGRKAWACASFNSQSDNIETPDAIWTQPLTPERHRVMRVCARIVAFRLHKRSLPAQALFGANILTGQGFTRHYDLGIAGGGHTDPTTDMGRWLAFGEMVAEEHARGGFRPTWGR